MRVADTRATLNQFGAVALNSFFRGLTGTPGVAVAVSGGSDSLALLLLARHLAPPGLTVTALTVDHRLRPESAQEAMWVRERCHERGIAHHVLRWEGPKPTSGIQAKARTARYGLMAAWCRAHQVPILLTGHTADDQAETVAMRAMRTQSAASLAGIHPRVDWDGIQVVRPLLGVRRADLQTYLRSQGLAWVNDPSNQDPRFERVRVRSALHGEDIPALAASAADYLAVSGTIAHDAGLWVLRQVRDAGAGGLSLPVSSFAALVPEVRVAALRRVIQALRPSVQAERADLLRLADDVVASTLTRRTLVGLVFAKRRNEVLIGREAGRMEKVWVDVPADGELQWDERLLISAPHGTRIGPRLLAAALPRLPGVPFWLQQSLPVAWTADGKFHSIHIDGESNCPSSSNRAGDLHEIQVAEALGIRAIATYVNLLKCIRET